MIINFINKTNCFAISDTYLFEKCTDNKIKNLVSYQNLIKILELIISYYDCTLNYQKLIFFKRKTICNFLDKECSLFKKLKLYIILKSKLNSLIITCAI